MTDEMQALVIAASFIAAIVLIGVGCWAISLTVLVRLWKQADYTYPVQHRRGPEPAAKRNVLPRRIR